MKIRIISLVAAGFIFMGCTTVFAGDSTGTSTSEESSGWLTCGNNRVILLYSPEVNLRKLEARLRSRYFSVSSAEKDLFSNSSYSIENRIVARLEALLSRVRQILGMDPEHIELKVKIFQTHQELSDEYSRQFGTTENCRAFYIHALGTIYSSMQDVSDSVISHEMAHAVIDNYFKIMPPEKTAELLATYVDSHLERE